MGNPALYIDGNNNWIFKNGLHDVVGSKPAGVFGYKIQGTKIGLFGAVNDFSLFEVGNGYVEVTEIEKSATPNDFYSDINEFLTACKDFFLKATAGGGGTDTTLQQAIDNETASVGGYIDVVYGALHLDDDGGEATLEPNNYQGIINFKARHINISTIQRSSSTTDDAKIVITDDRADKKGVEYYSDYSDSFGAHSLIDRNFAENKVFFNKKRAKIITSNYTINPATDEVINIGTLTADITVTIPLSSTLPTGFLFEYWIYKTGNDGFTVTIQLSGTEKFPLGYSKLILLSPEEFAHIGGGNGSGWSKLASQKIVLQTHRTSNWDASNFASDAPVPFEHADVLDNEEIFDWEITNDTRIVSKVSTRLELNYDVSFDSTGGGTWIGYAFIRKNGTTEIEGTRRRTGNYGGEDQGDSLPLRPIQMEAGDYLELVLNQDLFTGQLVSATVLVQSLL